ncbi:MAG TPA: DUF3333 domain-containing protein, partial [Geminicoccaceae bacterium]
MTEIAANPAGGGRLGRLTAGPRPTFEDSDALTRRRYAKEARLKAMGMGAIATAMALLALLLYSIVSQGYSAFWQTFVRLDVALEVPDVDPHAQRDPARIARVDTAGLVNHAVYALFPEVTDRQGRRLLRGIVSGPNAQSEVRKLLAENPGSIGQTVPVWVLADDEVDQFVKGKVDREAAEADRRLTDQVIGWIDRLRDQDRLERRFNWPFFMTGDSREPELAGIRGALMGSFYMMLVTLLVSVPVGIGAAVYLEEFAPKNRLTDLIEVNVNNLAAVPSIVFGLLGLAVFLNTFGMPRSAPL